MCHSGKNTGVLTIALYYSSVSATTSKQTLHQEAKQSIWNLTIIHINIHIGARPFDMALAYYFSALKQRADKR